MRMDSDFDVILDCDWMKKNMVDIMFSTSSLHIGCAERDRKQYNWPIDDNDTCTVSDVVWLTLLI